MICAVCFTNFGPYHVARLRALAARLKADRHELVAIEVASQEQTYPWTRPRQQESFTWMTLFAGQAVESVTATACRRAMVEALDRVSPDVIFVTGYARPESMAAARWCQRRGKSAILMSESQAIDRPHAWWKELVKMHRVRRFDGALVGGPRHRDYLVELGMPADRIAFGYNAVDHAHFATRALLSRASAGNREGLPRNNYFLSVCRFAPEKNLPRLIEAFARYRAQSDPQCAWDLVLCGDGPRAVEIEGLIAASGCAGSIHRPGFLQTDDLPRLYAHAGAFVLPSISEPWGLVVNEAAACGLPLLVSERAGCAATFVPDPEGTTGCRFDPLDLEEMTTKLAWMAALPDAERQGMGGRAGDIARSWGPDRFAQGALEAMMIARGAAARRERPTVVSLQ
jgi:glycosyltransferase involved in cell wall biosynthesis